MYSSVTRLLRPAAAVFLCVSISSCGDDPELVRKREEQKAEMLRLAGEMKVLEEKISQIPKDRSEELSDLKTEAEEQKEKIASLEEEIADLQSQKEEIEKEHEAYKKKYTLR